MKKIKFLSCAAMAAFFAMSLTSCEKENFTTDVEAPEVNVPTITIPGITIPEGYKPGDAVLSIQPTVVGFINGKAQVITDECEITYNGESTFKYTVNDKKGIDEIKGMKIVASYKLTIDNLERTYSAEKVIDIPAMSAGMMAVLTPTLIINASVSATDIQMEEGDVIYDEIVKKITITNTNPYFYTDYSFEYEYPVGWYTENVKYEAGYENDEEVKAIVDSFNDIYNQITQSNNEAFNWYALIKPVTVYANSQTVFSFTQWVDKTPITLYKNVTWSRSGETQKVDLVKFDYCYYYSSMENPTFEYLPNANGHGTHYHGHGHGDAANAGGGITWAE